MRAPQTFSKKRALNSIMTVCGAQPIAAEWQYEGERVHLHVGKEGVKVFQGMEERTDLLGDTLPGALIEALKMKEGAILDGVIMGVVAPKEEDESSSAKLDIL